MDQHQAEYEERLRRIILHSADVLPREVAQYLTSVALRPTREPAREALSDYKCLVDSIPKEYTDFVISTLSLPDEDAEDDQRHGMHERALGIREIHGFFPESHLNGPFLYLLRQKEQHVSCGR
jgi:hypothetical protein